MWLLGKTAEKTMINHIWVLHSNFSKIPFLAILHKAYLFSNCTEILDLSVLNNFMSFLLDQQMLKIVRFSSKKLLIHVDNTLTCLFLQCCSIYQKKNKTKIFNKTKITIKLLKWKIKTLQNSINQIPFI